MEKPKICIIACGGTIAGKAARADDLTGYTAGQASVDELLAAVPQLAEYARIESKQFCNIDSSDMTEALWLGLSRLVQETAARDDIDGIVITHGTDTMEETAFFLHLTVQTTKPIVLTGAMRPATAMGADGPLNLLAAVQTAAYAPIGAEGVVLVMNGRIYSARLVEKTDTAHVDAFTSRQFGCLGIIQDGRVYQYQHALRQITADTVFSCPAVLPKVPVIYAYVGLTPEAVLPLLAGADGVVVAGLGHGRLPAPLWQALKMRVKKGWPLVRASRTLGGIVTPVAEYAGTIAADTLTPQKAKILLQLALTKTKNPKEIQAFFEAY